MQEERHRSVSTPPSIEGIALATTYSPRKDSRPCPPKRSLKCTHCGKYGHTVDRCYRLHGFLPGTRNSKPNTGPKHSAHQVSSTTSSLPFTPELCQQLLVILNNSALPQSMSHQVGPVLDEDDWDGN